MHTYLLRPFLHVYSMIRSNFCWSSAYGPGRTATAKNELPSSIISYHNGSFEFISIFFHATRQAFM